MLFENLLISGGLASLDEFYVLGNDKLILNQVFSSEYVCVMLS